MAWASVFTQEPFINTTEI